MKGKKTMFKFTLTPFSTLFRAKQAERAAKNVDLGNVIAPLGYTADMPAKIAVPVDASASQGQA
jgi:hypothetical protein